MNSNKQKSVKQATTSESKEEKKVCPNEEFEPVNEFSEDKAAQKSEVESESTKIIDEPEEVAPSTSTTTEKGTKPMNKSAKTKSESPASSDKKSKPPNRSILQLKITLQGVTPPIWRCIQVLNSDTFFDLRHNINEAMGWMSDSSHQFIIPGPEKNILVVNGVMEGLIYDFEKDRDRLFKEQTTELSKFLSSPGDVIFYEFSLSESWIHKVVVEKILPPPPPEACYPKCKGGERACPPEECGGVDGYNHLMEVYNDPDHEEYDELINEWLEDMYPGYDPEKFEPKNIFKRRLVWLPV